MSKVATNKRSNKARRAMKYGEAVADSARSLLHAIMLGIDQPGRWSSPTIALAESLTRDRRMHDMSPGRWAEVMDGYEDMVRRALPPSPTAVRVL